MISCLRQWLWELLSLRTTRRVDVEPPDVGEIAVKKLSMLRKVPLSEAILKFKMRKRYKNETVSESSQIKGEKDKKLNMQMWC